MSSFIERLARSGTKGKERQVLTEEERELRSLQAMAIRMRQKAEELPKIIDREIAGEIWDETWEKYLDSRRTMLAIEQSAREPLPHNIRHQKYR